jgi:hypothetical protein
MRSGTFLKQEVEMVPSSRTSLAYSKNIRFFSGFAVRGNPGALGHVIRQVIKVKGEAVRDHFINTEQGFDFGNVVKK